MKFGYLNRKLAAGSLALALSITSLTSCHSYKENENGEVYLDGTISYEDLSDFKLIEMKTLAGNRLYITNFSSEKYYDVFTGLVIHDLKDKNTANCLVHEYKLGDYLVALDELKTEYTSDDIKKVLEHIDQEYKTETEKIK